MKAALIAGSILEAGFLVLLGLWLTRESWSDHDLTYLPGLFDYPSATLGDGLLLPLSAGLILAGLMSLPRTPRDRSVGVGFASAGAVVAATVQFLWLRDDDPGLNWTLPEPHLFNLAGWWHAVYFVAVASYFAATVALVAWRAHSARRTDQRAVVRAVLSSSGAGFALGALLSYSALAGIDSAGDALSARASLTSLVAAACALIAVFVLALRGDSACLTRPVVQAVVLAGGVLGVVAGHVPVQEPLGLSTVLFAVITIMALVAHHELFGSGSDAPAAAEMRRLNRGRFCWGLVTLVLIMPAWWGNVARHWGSGDVWLGTAWALAMAVAVAAVPLFCLGHAFGQWASTYALALTSIWLVLLIAAVATTEGWGVVSTSSDLPSVVVAVLIAGICLPAFRPLLRKLYHPDAVDDDHARALYRRSDKLVLAILLIAVFTASLSLLGLGYQTALAKNASRGEGHFERLADVVVWALVVVMIPVVFVALNQTLRFTRARAGRLLGTIFMAMWPLVLWIVGLFPGSFRVVGESRTMVVAVAVLAGTAGVLMAVWTANSILFNAVLFRGNRLDLLDCSFIAAAAVSTFVSSFVASTSALAQDADHPYFWVWGLGTAILVLVVNAALVPVCARLSMDRGGDFTEHSMPHNLVQDAFLLPALYVVVAVFPILMALLAEGSGVWERASTSFAVMAPMLGCLVAAYLECVNLNKEHAKKELAMAFARVPDAVRQELADDVAQCRSIGGRVVWVRDLAKVGFSADDRHHVPVLIGIHVKNQNAIAHALVFVTLAGALVLLGERDMSTQVRTGSGS